MGKTGPKKMFNKQSTNYKSQTIPNIEIRMTKTDFVNWVIVFCILFVIWNLFIGISAAISSELDTLPQQVRQAVVVEAAAGAVTATVSGWQRQDVQWFRVFGPVPAVIGRNGLAPQGEKHEGDGRTPSGVFSLRRAFGYEEGAVTGLSYRRVTEQDFWVDDSTSLQYNQWVNGPLPDVSHEVLRRQDGLYRYAVVIEYNTEPVVANNGSAIFLHVWRAADKPTAGCVAMAEKDLLKFLSWLDARQDPVIVLGKGAVSYVR